MDNSLNYWLAQLLILVFYVMTLLIYNRARKEYIGGKIGAAINLIMGFLLVLFLSDLADYFLLLSPAPVMRILSRSSKSC